MASDWTVVNWLWGYLIPIGMLLLVWGGYPAEKARKITSFAALAMAIAALGYWAVGFAFHMGGAQAVHPDDTSLGGLGLLLPLLPKQAGWGFLGLKGFFLVEGMLAPEVYRLFLAYLPIMTGSVLLIALSTAELRRWSMVVAAALGGALVVPIAACWMWGSGWLAHLGQSLGLGHGFVDFGGTTLLLWLPACFALGVLLAHPRSSTSDPRRAAPTYFPILANIGVLLMGLGWMGWALSQPFHTFGARLDWSHSALNVILGMAGAVVTSQLYAWLALGAPEAILAARGLAAGWGVTLACAPFVQPWQALILGLLSGALFPFVLYAVDHWLHLSNAAAILALGITGGVLGLLAVGVFADGGWGQGWNGVGALLPDGSNGTGVSGLWRGSMRQLQAQLVGLGAVGLWGILWGGAFGIVARVLGGKQVSEQLLPVSAAESAAMTGEIPTRAAVETAAMPAAAEPETQQDAPTESPAPEGL